MLTWQPKNEHNTRTIAIVFSVSIRPKLNIYLCIFSPIKPWYSILIHLSIFLLLNFYSNYISTMAPIILYHFPFSPVSRGVLLTARSLDIEIEIKKVNLFAHENLEPWYLEINPQHSVPCINDNGHILNESRAISQYLVNSRAPDSSLYPADPKIRSIIDQRLFFDAGTVSSRVTKVFVSQRRKSSRKRKFHIKLSVYLFLGTC